MSPCWPNPTSPRHAVGIRWHTGATDEIIVARRQNVTQYRLTDPAAIDLARHLGELTNDELAERLNAAGYVTGAGRPFDRVAVANMRHYHHIPQPRLLQDGETTVADIARRLGISHGAVIHWIARGWLPARRGLNDQWCVPFGPDIEADCRDRVARSAHIHQPDTTDPQAEHELTVGEVAAVLGSAPTSSTTGSNATTSTPAADPAAGCSSPSARTSRRPAGPGSPPRSTPSASRPRQTNRNA